MPEKDRIISLFDKLYKGEPWIDINIIDTLSKINATQAAQRVGKCNSIWEIVAHMIEWRKNVLQRVQGQAITSPSHNYLYPVPDQSDLAWQATLQQFEETQQQWLDFLKGFDMNALNSLYPNNQMTYYEHIQGILQHDCYHLGQIVLLKKLIP